MSDERRSSPAAQRNAAPIIAVLEDWLPPRGLVLEIASGTGEHAVAFASHLPGLDWQPSDADPDARRSIAAWRAAQAGRNVLPPLALDARAGVWPIERADAIVAINMVHISPWTASIGLLDAAARLLPAGAPLILYGPWIEAGVEPAPSNQAFDIDLRARNPEWGLRDIAAFTEAGHARGLDFVERRTMPANNLMLLFRRA